MLCQVVIPDFDVPPSALYVACGAIVLLYLWRAKAAANRKWGAGALYLGGVLFDIVSRGAHVGYLVYAVAGLGVAAFLALAKTATWLKWLVGVAYGVGAVVINLLDHGPDLPVVSFLLLMLSAAIVVWHAMDAVKDAVAK